MVRYSGGTGARRCRRVLRLILRHRAASSAARVMLCGTPQKGVPDCLRTIEDTP